MISPVVITLMFHRVKDTSQQFKPQEFANYIDYLVQNFPIVIPGQPLPESSVAICLTFDDAYFDFYHYVFPLLEKHNVKGILAVPTKYILDDTNQPPETRLNVPYAYDMENPHFAEKVPLCTWKELKEMTQSDNIILASHGHSHADLTNKKTNVHQEINLSKQILEEKLGKTIDYFVYPFGRMTKAIHTEVCKTYDYGIRIGNALNLGWDENNRFVYRTNADPLWLNGRSINQSLIRKLTLKYWVNKIRNK